EGDAGDLDRLPALEPDVSARPTDRDPRRRKRRRLLDQEALPARGVDWRAGLLGQVGEADDVIEVPVGDENRGAGGASGSERRLDRGGITARIDDHRLRRARRRPGGVGVRPDRPELELVALEAHGGTTSPEPCASAAGATRPDP